MSKKFYIGICCLALLATSVASGYSEDFEGYTGNVGDQWDLTPEFATSGWGTLYKSTGVYAVTSTFELAAGYNTAQGIMSGPRAGGARLLDDPQGANGTFVYTAMMNMDGSAGKLVFGTDELLAPQAVRDGWFALTFWDYEAFGGGTVCTDTYIAGGYYTADWNRTYIDFYDAGWVEVMAEVDTNASSRPTVLRTYVRDYVDDGSGPVGDGSWNQVDLGGTDGGFDLHMGGDDYKIEAIGFRVDGVGIEGTGCYVDNLVATVNPPWVPLPGDVDGNSFVDNDDLNIILANWGKTGMGREGGDLNDNGIVDGPDYAEVLSYWAPAEPPPKTAGVPEPVTLAILGIGSLLALIRRRRHQMLEAEGRSRLVRRLESG